MGRAFHAFLSVAIPSYPRCEIHQLVVHFHPDGIKAYGHERHTLPHGRRGKPQGLLEVIQFPAPGPILATPKAPILL